MKELSVVLCTFNEESFIKKTIKKIENNFPEAEIVIVDDNSTDNTCKIIKEFKDTNIKLIERKRVKGLASAFCAGVHNCSNDYIAWLDTNMEYVVDQFDLMLKEIDKGYDLILLSRYVQGGKDERSFLRVFSSKILNMICRIYLTNNIKDFSSGIFLMKKKIINEVLPLGYGHGEFFIEFIYKLYTAKYKIKEIPYTQKIDEIVSNSKTSPNIRLFLKLSFHYFIRVMLTKFRIN